MMPEILLSGFPSPVENMPRWLQYLDWVQSAAAFHRTGQRGIRKRTWAGANCAKPVALLVIGLITLSAANWFFRRKLG